MMGINALYDLIFLCSWFSRYKICMRMWIVLLCCVTYLLIADPSAKQSYSCISDEQQNRVSHCIQQISDGLPMKNGDGEGDDSRRGSVCKC